MEWVYKEFGLRLRGARRKLRLSQAYVAEYVGLSRTSVTNIERGRQRIPLHVAYHLAEAVRARPAELLPDAPEEHELPREVRELDEPVRQWVTRIVGEGEPAQRGGRRNATT